MFKLLPLFCLCTFAFAAEPGWVSATDEKRVTRDGEWRVDRFRYAAAEHLHSMEEGASLTFGYEGTAVAVRLAALHPPAAMVLRSPFTSLVDVGRVHYPFLPVGWLLEDRFSSIDLVGEMTVPTLVVAGDRDRVVPAKQSRRLFERIAGSKKLVLLTGLDHTDPALTDGPPLINAVDAFLATLGEDGRR